MSPAQCEDSRINCLTLFSCSYNALCLLVLVTGILYWGLQVTSSFSIWGCVLKGCFERGIFCRAKSRLKGMEDFNLEGFVGGAGPNRMKVRTSIGSPTHEFGVQPFILWRYILLCVIFFHKVVCDTFTDNSCIDLFWIFSFFDRVVYLFWALSSEGQYPPSPHFQGRWIGARADPDY